MALPFAATAQPKTLATVQCPRHPSEQVQILAEPRATRLGAAIELPRAVCGGEGVPHALRIKWIDGVARDLDHLVLPNDVEIVVRTRVATPPDTALPHGVRVFEGTVHHRLEYDQATDDALERFRMRVDIGAQTYVRLGINRITAFRCVGVFHGPPGTGKTTAFDRVTRSRRHRYTISLRAQLGGMLGDTERNTERLKKFVSSLATAPDAAVLFDDCDDVLGARGTRAGGAADRAHDGLVIALLELLDLAGPTAIIVTTNRLQVLDTALARRVSDPIPFALPDSDARMRITRALIAGTRLQETFDVTEADVRAIAAGAEGLAPADLAEAISTATIVVTVARGSCLTTEILSSLARRAEFRRSFGDPA